MSDSPLLDNLFGPLSRKYCVWFYWLSVIGFVFLVFIVITGLWMAFVVKKMPKEFFYHVVYTALMYLFFYFQNRLLYTMCVGTK